MNENNVIMTKNWVKCLAQIELNNKLVEVFVRQ